MKYRNDWRLHDWVCDIRDWVLMKPSCTFVNKNDQTVDKRGNFTITTDPLEGNTFTTVIQYRGATITSTFAGGEGMDDDISIIDLNYITREEMEELSQRVRDGL